MSQREIKLNFVATPFGSGKLVGLSLLGIAIVVAVVMRLSFISVKDSIATLEEQLATNEQAHALNSTVRSQVNSEEITEKRNHAQTVIRKLTMPWDRLFESIESASNPSIAILSIEPDETRHLVTISGEAKDMSDVLAFIASLETQQSLTKVYLRHHQVKANSSERVILFNLSANWVREKSHA